MGEESGGEDREDFRVLIGNPSEESGGKASQRMNYDSNNG